MIGSFQTGVGTSVETGTGSAETATGVCAPAPGLWLTDGASFVTGSESVLTATEPPACTADTCAPGQTLVDITVVGPAGVATDSILTPPLYGVLEIPVGVMPDCTNLRLTITLDYQVVGGSAGIHAYLNNTGMDLLSRDFTLPTGGNAPQLANTPVITDGAFHTYTMVIYPANTPAYSNFSGPLPAQSVYLWPPALFPAFNTSTNNVRNVRVVITTV